MTTLNLNPVPTSPTTATFNPIEVVESLLDYLESDADGDFGYVVIPRILAAYILLAASNRKSLAEICCERRGLPIPPTILNQTHSNCEWTWVQDFCSTWTNPPSLIQISCTQTETDWSIECQLLPGDLSLTYLIAHDDATAEMIEGIAEVFRIVFVSRNIETRVNFNLDEI